MHDILPARNPWQEVFPQIGGHVDYRPSVRRPGLLLLTVCFFIFKGYGQTYIQDVTIIDVVNQKLLPQQTVAISNGVIATIRPSISFYDELLAMKQSGLTNWQIIQSATINPAKILDQQHSSGSIAVGKKADLLLLNANPVDSNPDTLIATTPETLVQQQLNAFNARNIDAFLAPYADSIELYDFPNELIGKGKEMMRQQYGSIFNQFPNLHCEIKGRIIHGNTVVDHESITGMGKPEAMEAIAIYEIKNGKIAKAYFVR